MDLKCAGILWNLNFRGFQILVIFADILKLNLYIITCQRNSICHKLNLKQWKLQSRN